MDIEPRPGWARWVPADGRKAGWMTVGLSLLVGIGMVVLGTKVLREYGLVLFLGTPLVLGFVAPLFYGLGAPRKLSGCLGVAFASQIALFAWIVMFGLEGIACVVMALPLWITCALIGTCAAYPIHRSMWRGFHAGRGFPVGMLLLVLMLPLMAGAERVGGGDAPLLTLTSRVEIDAPPMVVWKRLVEFPDMPRPTAWPFRVGVAYPVRAELVGSGVGATRYCVFSTGKAEEPVRVWEVGKVLDIDVVSTPPPMVEWSFWPDVEPAHLHGYLESVRARFELTALPGGRTELVGTSWYRNRVYPVAYWRLWSDAIIKEVHRAVFAHVKALAERDVGRG